jgi:hypothetical protein
MSDNEKGVLISVMGLRELAFSYKDPEEFYPELKGKEIKTEMELQMRYSWNFENEMFGVYTKFFIYIKKDDVRTDLVEYLCTTDFRIADLKTQLKEKDEGEFDLNRELEVTMVKMSIAHGRGMFFQKTCQTRFKGVVYPLININNILLSKNPGGLKLSEKLS